jgi:hypothetical protein
MDDFGEEIRQDQRRRERENRADGEGAEKLQDEAARILRHLYTLSHPEATDAVKDRAREKINRFSLGQLHSCLRQIERNGEAAVQKEILRKLIARHGRQHPGAN